MILIDTSVWLTAFRDLSGTVARRLTAHVGTTPLVNAPFIVTELLQGARDEKEWSALSAKLAQIQMLDLPATIWADSARIFYDLQRLGITPRSTIDCYLAQLCLVNQATLLHCDRDFEAIALVRPLAHVRFDSRQASQP